MINEQELAQAVERLREGDDNGLLVKYDKVMEVVMHNDVFVYEILDDLLNGNLEMAKSQLDELFEDTAAMLLREAYRTKLEHEAGL